MCHPPITTFADQPFSTLPGNGENYAPISAAVKGNSPLKGKTIIFLGSSITKGYASCGDSFPDYLAAADEIIAIKEAVNGTTLVAKDENAYIPRMQKLDPHIPADAFVCQLSTNDASQQLPLGTVSESFDLTDFDTATVAGAMEYIIAYARNIWNCPVVFYTNPRYDMPAYGRMVELLLLLQKKWNIGVIDFWNDPAFNAIRPESRTLWMADSIHPTRAGYRDWWLPEFEAYLPVFLSP